MYILSKHIYEGSLCSEEECQYVDQKEEKVSTGYSTWYPEKIVSSQEGQEDKISASLSSEFSHPGHQTVIKEGSSLVR